MTRTERDLRADLARALALDSEEAEQAALEDVVRHADAGGHRRIAFDARRALADAYCVGRQWDKAFPLFSRCLSDYDRHPGEYSPAEDWALRQWYARIIATMAEFPDITFGQISQAFADLEQRLRSAGHNLREVYGTHRWVAQLVGDWDEEERYYRLWLEAGGPEPGDVWDFEAEVERLALRGDEPSLGRALRLAAPVLDGELTFSEPAVPIWCLMLLPLARIGEHEMAAELFWRAEAELFGGSGRVYRYEYHGMLHEFCALTGNEYQGMDSLFQPGLRGYFDLNRPTGKMEYAVSIALVCRELVASGLGAQEYSPSWLDEPLPYLTFGEQARQTALDLAARFDQRNGSTAQGDRIRARLAAPRVADQLDLRPKRLRRPPPRALARLQPVVPPGLPGEALLDRAEWHYARGEYDATAQYLAAVRDPSPSVAARVDQLLVLLLRWDDPGTEEVLERVARVHLAAGDRVRHLVSRGRLGQWYGGRGDTARAVGILTDVVSQLAAAGDQRALAWAEHRLAIQTRARSRAQAWRTLERAQATARRCGDPVLLGDALLTAAAWQQNDHPRRPAAYAAEAKTAFTAAAVPGRVVDALESIRESHAEAGTMDQFYRLVWDEIARIGPAAPPRLLGYLRFHRGRALVDAGNAASALEDLRFAVGEARSRAAEDPYQAYYLAVAYHATGLFREAAYELEGYLTWLDNLRRVGRLKEPDLDRRAHALYEECQRQTSGAPAR